MYKTELLCYILETNTTSKIKLYFNKNKTVTHRKVRTLYIRSASYLSLNISVFPKVDGENKIKDPRGELPFFKDHF